MSRPLRLALGFAAAVVGVAIFLATRAKDRDIGVRIPIFHWVPGSAPLKVLGNIPFSDRQGSDMTTRIEPRLLETLKGATSGGGELRLVAEILLDSKSATRMGAVLFQAKPQAPVTLQLLDGEIVVYSEQPPGFATFPKSARPTGQTLTLSAGKNAQVDLLEFQVAPSSGRGVAGASLLNWW